MQILRGNQAAIMEPTKAFELTLIQQIVLGVSVTLTVITSLLLTNSFIVIAGIVGAAIMFAVIRNGVSSLFTFIIINVVLTLRTKDAGINGAPSPLDLLLGMMLVLIMGYWVVRLRILERQSISRSVGQLLLLVFMIWAVFVTIVGLQNDHNFPNDAIREILNLLPLIILPLLYERFIEPGSKIESALFSIVILSAALILIGNIWTIRSNIARAAYLYQIGRGRYDLSLTMFIILIMTSTLMRQSKWWQTLPTITLFLLGIVGLSTLFSRNSYISTPLAMIVVLWLGNDKERVVGMKYLMYALGIGLAIAIPIVSASRVLRLILLRYAGQLLTVKHYHNDLSLQMRYTEWRDEWHAILQSPILGHGFGTQFRTFDLVFHLNSWMSFSHSGYLYIVYKTGFFGALLFFAAYLTFMVKGFSLARERHFSPRTRVVLRASFAFLLIVLAQAYLGPVFDSKTSMIWLGLVWGYYLALEKQTRKKTIAPT
jgi:O-antigen ligase